MKIKKENQLRAWPICPTARRFMRKLLTITFTISGCLAFCPRPAQALVFSAPSPKFVYTDVSGKKQSAQVVLPENVRLISCTYLSAQARTSTTLIPVLWSRYPNHTERFRVQVVERTGNTLIGRIDNALLFSDHTAGDLIAFGAENIYDRADE